MKNESKLWQKLKKSTPNITWTRVESWASFGFPDLVGYHETCGFFTVELKIINNKKLAFSPHQISFHMRHPTRTFILAATPDLSTPKLYPGSTILDLRAGKLDACGLQLDAWGSIESLLLDA
jgi:hypothetical protein